LKTLYAGPLTEAGVPYILPSTEAQAKLMDIIDRMVLNTAGDHSRERDELLQIISEMKRQGATDILLACTELPLVITKYDCPDGMNIIDAMDTLEDATVKYCLAV
jgi:aspartate/glutamate racemase